MSLLDFVFCVPGLAFSGDTLKTGSLGGSETAGLCLARELAALGHHVTMFCNTPKVGVYDGVNYHQLDDFRRYARQAPHDVTVVQRAPQLFGQRMNSRLNVLWLHDMALGREANNFRSVLWNVDKVAVLSDYHAHQVGITYQIAEGELLWQTRNGIDLDLFPAAAAHDPYTLVFGARPERGLDVLLGEIFPALLKEEPALTLYLASYGNAVPQLRDFYEACGQKIDALGERCRHLQPMSKRDYYTLLASAGVYVYPTPSPLHKGFAEISCITAMECQAVGLPIVTSQRGALPETIARGAGVLLQGDPWTPEYRAKFVEAVLNYVRHPVDRIQAGNMGRALAQSLSWAKVAEQWAEDCERFIVERNESPSRLVRHFWRRSDIMAAKAVIADLEPGAERERLEALVAPWNFADAGAQGLSEQYEKIGQTHTEAYESSARETRFGVLKDWMERHPDAQRILDFGCAQAGYMGNLAQHLGRDWLGVDIDQHALRLASQHLRKHVTNPDARVRLKRGDASVDLSDEKPFDCLVAFEILEHVPDPTALLDSLERWVKPDGWVVITVPHGPWEWISYHTYEHRAHLWEYDQHDLRDLLGKKKNLRIDCLLGMVEQSCDEPIGWHLIQYQVDGTPTGTIDLTRKRRLQRPRETVSLLMIAGADAGQTMGWALDPDRLLVDEIIIGNCGGKMSDLAKLIAEGAGARIIDVDDPVESGFEVPRNQLLPYATMDWVLWHDTDERLINGARALKYLRSRGYYTGLAFKQHNFSCESRQDPMTPIRLFRRGPRADGAVMRWHGMVHEHPEYKVNEGVGQWIVITDAHLAHLGYLSDDTVIRKYNRNLLLLRRDIERNPDRVLQKHYLCRDLIVHVNGDLNMTGGVLTPDIKMRCDEVVRLYREYFLGKPVFLNTDTIQYYSRALEILGEGVEVQWAWGADGQASEMGEPRKVRLANYDEVEREFNWRLRELVTPKLAEWW